MVLIEPIRNGKYIKDGAYWLAIQIWAASNLKIDDTIVFPSIADPHIQMGYFQNPEVEVNFKYLKEKNLEIVRRATGGGTIYIDSNSVNICYLIPYKKGTEILGNYAKFYEPTIKILKELGAKNITQSGKNDLTIDGKKVSGAAMMLLDDVIYGGNSLLYNVDYDAMSQVLNPNRKKIEAKGVKSVSQRVAALSQYLDEPYRNLDIFEFKDLMIKKIFNVDDLKNVNRYIMTDKDWEQVDELIKTRYKNWEWTYGLSPRYEYNRDARLAIGTINFSLAIENQRIEKIKISGDFFAKKDLLELEKALIGTKMTHEDLLKAFSDADLQSYFFNEIKPEEVVKIILDEE
ncbi:lipoyltransferase and lipoate-protein ligase [Mycoplasma leachii PG50]|uniref:lipoate--protein ligase n=2 Tax=Mycoplasma leachii TaxID=2105 RepID=E4PU68_MYCLG|nr:lipoate--protein ligase [Mycoplasma leachii]ADR24183.1 lipoyltransferase and lipoate-protein ligase [Mycoplasma leachii PG50]PTD31395.1 Lipoate-protein ligase A [Mycoplasma leachii 06049]CBV66992.1 Lipoate-protein ligase A [Mycoplasma leachii 99/014/6]